MEIYSIEGHYEYLGTIGKLTGEIYVNEEGIIKGDIIDHNSRVPNQKLSGEVIRDSKETTLAFLKFPPDDGLANLLYGLKKLSVNGDLSGKYEGEWHALPRAVGTVIQGTNHQLVMALKQIPEYEGGEYAELTLKKV